MTESDPEKKPRWEARLRESRLWAFATVLVGLMTVMVLAQQFFTAVVPWLGSFLAPVQGAFAPWVDFFGRNWPTVTVILAFFVGSMVAGIVVGQLLVTRQIEAREAREREAAMQAELADAEVKLRILRAMTEAWNRKAGPSGDTSEPDA